MKRKQVIEKNLNVSFYIQDLNNKDMKTYLKSLNIENNLLISKNVKVIYFYISLIILNLFLIPFISILSLVFIVLFIFRVLFLYNQNLYIDLKRTQNLEIINN